MSKFSRRFKEERKRKGLTQKELAQKFYTDKSSISKYENGHSMPEVSVLQKYADFFGVSTDYLLGNTDERKPADHVKEEYIQKYNATEAEVKELFERFNVHLDGEVLTEEDKKSVINFLRMLRDRDKNKGS